MRRPFGYRNPRSKLATTGEGLLRTRPPERWAQLLEDHLANERGRVPAGPAVRIERLRAQCAGERLLLCCWADVEDVGVPAAAVSFAREIGAPIQVYTHGGLQ